MPKLIVFDSFNEVNADEFLKIYKESSMDNSVRWYPALNAKDALKKYEAGYLEYMQNEFFINGRRLFVLADKAHYYCALRMTELSSGKYYLEALETNPAFRKKGFGKELILQTEKLLKEQNSELTIISHVEKDNVASLNTHFSAGFKITADYYIEDGERYDSDYELTYDLI